MSRTQLSALSAARAPLRAALALPQSEVRDVDQVGRLLGTVAQQLEGVLHAYGAGPPDVLAGQWVADAKLPAAFGQRAVVTIQRWHPLRGTGGSSEEARRDAAAILPMLDRICGRP